MVGIYLDDLAVSDKIAGWLTGLSIKRKMWTLGYVKSWTIV
jgi:hypothetical protein